MVFLKKTKNVYFVTVLLVLCGVVASCYYLLPKLLSPLFTGPDGVRWVGIFVLWMGTLGIVYYCAGFYIEKFSFSKETFWAGAVVVFFAGMIFFVSLQRFSSGLRYHESYNETMAIKVAHGKSLYPDPEQQPLGTIYTPFFFILTGIIHWIFPAPYAYGRLVSLAATLLCAWAVFFSIRVSGKTFIHGLWGCGLFLATYAPMQKLYDQSFVDPLLMCCVCITLIFFQRNSSIGDFSALFFCGLACFTKQSALFPFVVVCGVVFFRRRPWWVYLPLIFWVSTAVILLAATHGWIYRYCVVFPSKHAFRTVPLPDVLYRLFILQIPLWIGLVHSFYSARDKRFWMFFAAVFLSSFLGILKGGGWLHALFPLQPLLCIAAVNTLYRYKIFLAIQLLVGIFNPFSTLYPWATIKDIDRAIVHLVNKDTTDVWLPMESYLYKAASVQEWDNFCALLGPIWAGVPPPQRLTNALETTRIKRILIRENSMDQFNLFHPHIKELIQRHYISEHADRIIFYRPDLDSGKK